MSNRITIPEKNDCNIGERLKRAYKELKGIDDITGRNGKKSTSAIVAAELLEKGYIDCYIPTDADGNIDEAEKQKKVYAISKSLKKHVCYDSLNQIDMQYLFVYVKYFDCSMDYLIGKIDTFNHDLIDATEKTGLSEKTIETIAGYDNFQKELLESMATADNDILKHTLNTLFLTAYGMYYPTITIKNDSIGLDKTIPTNETKSFMLASAQNDFNEIITSVFNLYQPQFEKLSIQMNESLKKELKKAKSTD